MKTILIALAFVTLLVGCGNDDVYTLYRSAVGMPDLRIHIATFDADDSKDPKFKTYNQDNCLSTQKLFSAQEGVSVRYWCEKGYFKK
jgi:hypothetical protein